MDIFYFLITAAICHIGSTASYRNHFLANTVGYCTTEETFIIPSDYVYYATFKSSYKYYATNTTWDDARNYCEMDGAHLAIPDTNDEADFLRSFRGHNRETWLGFHNFFNSNNFTTVLDGVFNQTLYVWATDNPDNLTTENCGTTRMDGLNNRNCSTSLDYICEINC